MKPISRKSEMGFGLLETAVAMAVVLGIAAGALAFYSSNKKNAGVIAIVEDIRELHYTIERLYTARPGYDGLTEERLVASGMLPAYMVDGTQIVPSSRRTMTLYTNSHGCTWASGCIGRYGLKFWGIPVSICKKLAHEDFPGQPSSIAIGSSEITFTPPYDRSAIETACEDTYGATEETAFRIFYRK